MKAVGSNNLKKNHSSGAIFSIIFNTKLNEKPVICWRMINGKKVTVDVYMRVIRKFRDEFIIRPLRENGKKTLNNLLAGSEKLNLYLPSDLVLCQCDIKKVDSNGDIVLKMPEMIAQIDRRKYLRLFIDNGISASVDFSKEISGYHKKIQKFSKNCFDISAGGFSIILSKTESKFFQNNDNLNQISLDLDGKKTQIDGMVINIFDIEPDDQNGLLYRSKKVCVQYRNLDFKQEKVINDYVFKHIDFQDVI